MNNWFISVNPSQFGELKVWFAPTPPNLRLQSTVICTEHLGPTKDVTASELCIFYASRDSLCPKIPPHLVKSEVRHLWCRLILSALPWHK